MPHFAHWTLCKCCPSVACLWMKYCTVVLLEHCHENKHSAWLFSLKLSLRKYTEAFWMFQFWRNRSKLALHSTESGTVSETVALSQEKETLPREKQKKECFAFLSIVEPSLCFHTHRLLFHCSGLNKWKNSESLPQMTQKPACFWEVTHLYWSRKRIAFLLAAVSVGLILSYFALLPFNKLAISSHPKERNVLAWFSRTCKFWALQNVSLNLLFLLQSCWNSQVQDRQFQLHHKDLISVTQAVDL